MLQKVRKQGIRFWDERTFWHEIIYKSLIPTFGSLIIIIIIIIDLVRMAVSTMQKVGIQVLNDKQYTTDKLQQLNKTNTSV